MDPSLVPYGMEVSTSSGDPDYQHVPLKKAGTFRMRCSLPPKPLLPLTVELAELDAE